MLAAERIALPDIGPGDYPPSPAQLPRTGLRLGRYELRVARSPAELDAALRLRFEVFNLELGEGLRESYTTGRDLDDLDLQCHHLLVEDRRSGEIVGTYRLQTSEMAARGHGFYAAGEFDLATMPAAVLADAVELGRACIARPHRNSRALFLLWRGIGDYLVHNRKRFLFGCCSLTSRDPRDGIALERDLERRGAVAREVRVRPRPGFGCTPALAPDACLAAPVPRLFGMYLAMGARVASEPAIDRAFGTIDFLVVLDTASLDADSRMRFLDGSGGSR
jgi:putative hemolysin